MARVLMTPEEASWVGDYSAPAESLVTSAGSGWAKSTTDGRYWHTVSPRTDSAGNGGALAIDIGRACRGDHILLTSPSLGNVEHGFVGYGWRINTSSPAYCQGQDSSGTMIWRGAIAASSGANFVLSNASGNVATGTAELTLNSWFNFEIEFVLDGAGNATIKTYVDGVLDINHTGSGFATGDVSNIRWKGQCNTYVDDLAVNTITLSYDGGSGSAPAVGNTVTDGTTGSTAIVSIVDGDGTSGTLTIRSPSGNFGDGNALTNGSGFSAVVNAPNAAYVGGLEPNSGRVGTQYQVLILPTGAGSTTQLTPSTGQNFENADAIPSQTATTQNTADAADELDTYTNNASTQIPALTTVQCVASVVHANSSMEGIDGVRHILADGASVATPSPRQTLATSYKSYQHIYNVRPDNGAGWDRTAIVTTLDEHGVKFVS